MKVKTNLKVKMMMKVSEERIKRKTKKRTKRKKNFHKRISFNRFCKTFTVMLTNQIMTSLSWKMKNSMNF